mmetsp:Transcript_2464/g.5762  ORF Transcript_2464/g.5762 Transcript_2464/m.5762 type:complete len:159 (-) Transcript_2464:157-633(-)
MSSTMERPKKILVLCSGSRGDVQPYIAVVRAQGAEPKHQVGGAWGVQFQSISAKELAAAIRKCAASDDVRARAKDVVVAMRSEDCSRRVAEYVDDFWAKHVRTLPGCATTKGAVRGPGSPQTQSTQGPDWAWAKTSRQTCRRTCGCNPHPRSSKREST